MRRFLYQVFLFPASRRYGRRDLRVRNVGFTRSQQQLRRLDASATTASRARCAGTT